ncbi:hypothetical protein [Alloyangia mangrovi]|uniref:hypothetical protein n=1 Tax=Alloyangia mangrovi TaxID=1779329 RepID=UPI0021A34C16|nr:hypothetical protein [Alloyangia mangrovi]
MSTVGTSSSRTGAGFGGSTGSELISAVRKKMATVKLSAPKSTSAAASETGSSNEGSVSNSRHSQ